MPTLTLKKKNPPVIEVSDSLAEVVQRLETATEKIASKLVERTEEVEAAKLCLLTKSHLMLEGRHGIAKSMLANLFFNSISGAKVYRKQFMKTTQVDEIFGPMNSAKYREEAIWEHNTEGYLPTAHFFFGDEIYRASDQALPSMMGILNERVFYNGSIPQNCPLITAIGTTNFQTDTEELSAFHDRWHVKIASVPLTSPASIRRMLRRFLEVEIVDEDDSGSSIIELKDILLLHKKLARVELSQEVLDLAETIMSKLPTQLGNMYISDRRKCLALRFVQANALCDKRMSAKTADLDALRYGLIRLRDKTHEDAWTNVHTNVVGSYQSVNQERKNIIILEKMADKYERIFQSLGGDANKAKELWKALKTAITAIHDQDSSEKPTQKEILDRQRAVVNRYETVLKNLEKIVSF